MIELKKLQIAQIILLEKLNKICIENNIKYSLGYGSMLGVIRHKGFIPWDNDIDVLMKRKEYDKFIKIFKEDEDLFLQNYLTDKSFGLHLSRLMLKDTLYENHYNKFFKRKKNIYIDIFPIDEVRSNLFLLKIKFILIKILTQAKEIKLGRKKSIKRINTILNIFIEILFYFTDIDTIDKKIEELCIDSKEKKIKYVGCYFGDSVAKEFFKKDIFNDFIFKEFEENKYPILKEYDKYLQQNYGNYMKFPPTEIRNQIFKKLEKSILKFGKWEKEIEKRLDNIND